MRSGQFVWGAGFPGVATRSNGRNSDGVSEYVLLGEVAADTSRSLHWDHIGMSPENRVEVQREDRAFNRGFSRQRQGPSGWFSRRQRQLSRDF
jgi:hypothetical protein